jgi:Cys-tRNA(Pro)/Cys-tRNA(Cys) deacylase
MKKVKTNAMRLLDKEKIPYELLSFDLEKGSITPEYIAKEIGRDVERIFKTIVTVGHSGEYYVFCLQIIEELDLKKAAKAASEKSIELIDQSDLLKIAGYERGGTSPLGMKKSYVTFFDDRALNFDKVIVSAGKRGYQIEVPINGLMAATKAKALPLLMETKSIFK